jgi:hypothetical protein
MSSNGAVVHGLAGIPRVRIEGKPDQLPDTATPV